MHGPLHGYAIERPTPLTLSPLPLSSTACAPTPPPPSGRRAAHERNVTGLTRGFLASRAWARHAEGSRMVRRRRGRWEAGMEGGGKGATGAIAMCGLGMKREASSVHKAQGNGTRSALCAGAGKNTTWGTSRRKRRGGRGALGIAPGPVGRRGGVGARLLTRSRCPGTGQRTRVGFRSSRP